MLKLLIKNILLGFAVLFCWGSISFAQESQKTPIPTPTVENTEEEILEIRTELIQTGVTVFDKKGQFVKNLKREEFDLSVDGKPVSLSFFEQIVSGMKSSDESEENQANKEKSSIPNISNRLERNIIFVVDDVHLSVANAMQVKRMINKFIEQDTLPNDRIAIASTSGNLGFLQQFTDNKIVWRAAASKISSRNYSANDRMRPPMTEYEAYLINRYDPQLTDYFVQLDETPGDRDSKVERIRSRARGILEMANSYSRITYSALDSVVRASAALPGRKTVFFISDGFLPDITNSNYSDRMQRITDAAARTNTVIYSLDAKGLEAGFPEEGSTATNIQLGLRVQSGERFELQTGLSELADRTGGKFVRNTNDLQAGIRENLEESSNYYLLAWQPAEEGDQNSSKKSPSLKKISVKVRNRPELTVRFQKGYLTANMGETKESKRSNENKKQNNSSAKVALSPAEKDINTALTSQLQVKDLPTKLLLHHINLPNEGNVIISLVQIDQKFAVFSNLADNKSANVALLGVLYNSEGKQVDSFSKRITIAPLRAEADINNEPKIVFDYQSKAKPGLYQMRVVARDEKSGRIGSTNQWIEVSDETSPPFSVSSLLISEVFESKNAKAAQQKGVTANEKINIERKFSRSSKMRYTVFAYSGTDKNAALLKLSVQTKVRQLDKTIMESSWISIKKDGQDPLRLASASEIPLADLNKGVYILDVSVRDETSKKIISQQVVFEVE